MYLCLFISLFLCISLLMLVCHYLSYSAHVQHLDVLYRDETTCLLSPLEMMLKSALIAESPAFTKF